MIRQIENLPDNVAGFKASGEVTKEDFTNIVIPRVKQVVEKTGKLNYMLVLEDNAKDWSAGAWLQDALLGVKNLTKWNRCAIVSDSEGIQKFTDIFSKIAPGEFKGFAPNELEQAKDWVSERVAEAH